LLDHIAQNPETPLVKAGFQIQIATYMENMS